MPENSTRKQSSVGVAVVGVVIGVLYAVPGIIHGQVVHGVTGLVIILAFVGLAYGMRRRSEAAQLLVGDPGDERQAQIMRNALAAAGQVLAAVLLVWWLIAIAAEADYLPVLTTLLAVFGFSFIGATVWFTRRG